MKIGITISNLKNLDDFSNFFSNGLNQHLFTLKNYLENNNEVFLISNNNSTTNKYKFISSIDCDTIATLDIIICVGLTVNTKAIKNINPNVKTIFYSMGNVYQCDIYNILELNGASSVGDSYFIYDEIWISPQFEFSIDYYKYKYQTNNVFVAPFFWSDKYIKNRKDKILKFKNEVHIGVFESNLCKDKSFVIPMIACEKAQEYVSSAKILNTAKFKNKDIINFFNISKLYKERKLTAENRWAFPFVMSNYCNIVISYVENWDLNYLYLECFYLGIPLIHNSKMLKDYGYYYEGCDATGAAEHIKNLKLNGFDREAYIGKHKEVLFKFSLENPRVTYFLDSRLGLLDNNIIQKEVFSVYYVKNIDENVKNFYNKSIINSDFELDVKDNLENIQEIITKIKGYNRKILIVLDNSIAILDYKNFKNYHTYSFKNYKPELAVLKLNRGFSENKLLENSIELRGFKGSLYFQKYFKNSIELSCPVEFKAENYKNVNNNKIAILQIYDENIKDYGVLSHYSVESYCKKHNYDYYAFREKNEKYVGTYLKAKYILEIIDKYDYVLFLDADIVITNYSYSVESIIKLSNKDLLLCSDPGLNLVNAGAVLCKNSQSTNNILKEWDNKCMEKGTLFVHDPPGGDQKLLIDIISQKENRDKVHIFDEPIFNTHPDYWEKDTHFLVHLMGCSNDIRCNFMKKILTDYQLTIDYMNKLELQIINLDIDKTKLEKIKANLNKHNIKFKRYSAINGRNYNLTDKDKQYLKNVDYDINIKKGVLGCHLSHIKLLEEFINSDKPYLLIAEDDITIIEPQFNLIINNILNWNNNLSESEKFNLVFLSCCCTIDNHKSSRKDYVVTDNTSSLPNVTKVLIRKKKYRIDDKYSLFYCQKSWMDQGTRLLLWSKKGAKDILKKYYNGYCKYSIDHFYIKNIPDALIIYPSLCLHSFENSRLEIERNNVNNVDKNQNIEIVNNEIDNLEDPVEEILL